MSALIWQNLDAKALVTDHGWQVEWDRLNALRSDLPFLGAEAMVTALQVFAVGRERLLVGRSGQHVCAMLLVVPDGFVRWRTFQPSQVPLGAWVADPALGLPEICRSLLRGPLGLCLGFSITQVDPMLAPRVPDAPDSRSSDYIDTAWVDITGSFEDYWSARGKNLRQNMRKQRSKLAADGIETSLTAVREPEGMAQAVARYGQLESSGWKASQGTAIHLDNDQGRFYSGLLESAARRGEAVVFEYRFDDRIVAMNLCLLRHGTMVVLKTTYDESVPKTLSPAFLLREDEFKFIFSDGLISKVEYFGRVMEWHTKLTGNCRTLYHLSCYRWPILKSWAGRRRKLGAMAAVDDPIQ